jgi:hypothetical protein
MFDYECLRVSKMELCMLTVLKWKSTLPDLIAPAAMEEVPVPIVTLFESTKDTCSITLVIAAAEGMQQPHLHTE